MIKKSFNFLFWGGIAAFIAYTVSNHFDSFEIANTQFQEEKYEDADVAISKYNATNHKTIRTVNGYILQADISEQLDRLYLAKELASHALVLSQKESFTKGICLSQNSLQKSKLLIGDVNGVEQPLLYCLDYFNTENNDFDKLKTILNLAHYYLILDNKKFLTYFEQAEEIATKKDSLSYLLVDLYVDNMIYQLKHNNFEIAFQMINKAIELQEKDFSKQTSKLAYFKILAVTPIVNKDSNLQALEFIQSVMKNKNLKFSISMKIHTLIIMGQIYKNLEDFDTALIFDKKALELFNTFPTKEIHAIEGAMIYKQLISDYSRVAKNNELEIVRNDSKELLKNFPIIQQNFLN